eukprot:600127-Amphidinium_carterae.1
MFSAGKSGFFESKCGLPCINKHVEWSERQKAYRVTEEDSPISTCIWLVDATTTLDACYEWHVCPSVTNRLQHDALHDNGRGRGGKGKRTPEEVARDFRWEIQQALPEAAKIRGQSEEWDAPTMAHQHLRG